MTEEFICLNKEDVLDQMSGALLTKDEPLQPAKGRTKMEKESKPLVVLFGYRGKKDAFSFIGRRAQITLHGNAVVMEKVLRLCNGLNRVQDIMEKLARVDANVIMEMLSVFEAEGIVRDSRELYERFHEDSANPTMFSHDLGSADVARIMGAQRLRPRDGQAVPLPLPNRSGVVETIGLRQSTRNFKAGQISGEVLSGLLRAVYGVGLRGHWSVPSGGGLHPLDIYLIVPSHGQVIPRGTYRWNPEKHEPRMISDRNPSTCLVKALNTKALLENAACIICIGANLKRSTAKYANRGYRYTLLEAGHAAQNGYLYCAERGLGIVEYGGFLDEPLARELGLHYPDEAVMITLIIGIARAVQEPLSPTADQQMAETVFRLRHMLVGEGKPITRVFTSEPRVGDYAMPRWTATARYRPILVTASDRNRCRASGLGFTLNEAELKALAEGFERYSTEYVRVDCRKSARDLEEPFLDPRRVVPYAARQLRFLNRLGSFSPVKEMDWVLGERQNTGEGIWVPTELVFYGAGILRRSGRKRCYFASSSGVATHFDKRLAIASALFELAERDAISVTWYAKRHVSALAHGSFPSELRDRISHWETMGYQVTILDVTLDGPPVALALIWSREKMPALIAGAGSRATFLEAATRAFDEAELLAMSWHRLRPKRNMRPSDVRSVTDHGRFYIDPKNLVHAQWLLDAEETTTLPDDFNGDWSKFDPVVVDITPKEHVCGLTVVRVLSEKLLPINFGYGSEHYTHRRMASLGLRWRRRYPSIPHFFA